MGAKGEHFVKPINADKAGHLVQNNGDDERVSLEQKGAVESESLKKNELSKGRKKLIVFLFQM